MPRTVTRTVTSKLLFFPGSLYPSDTDEQVSGFYRPGSVLKHSCVAGWLVVPVLAATRWGVTASSKLPFLMDPPTIFLASRIPLPRPPFSLVHSFLSSVGDIVGDLDRRILIFLGLPDPDPLVRGPDPSLFL